MSGVTGGASAAARLAAAATALGCPLPDGAIDRLLGHAALLQRWNRVHNLTAVRDAGEAIDRHVVDCLAAVAPLRRWLATSPASPSASTPTAGVDVSSAPFPEDRPSLANPAAPNALSQAPPIPRRIVDVGSGGGLPGVALAIAEPQAWRVTCVDAVAKKAAFVRQVAGELRLSNVDAVHGRIERVGAGLAADVVISRAFASLADFTAWSRSALAEHGVWVAMKGRRPDDEIAALPPSVTVFHVEPVPVPGLDAQRCLVWMRPS